jgi:hypothetical protein
MRSMLSVDRSLLNALNSIELPSGVLKRSVQQVVTRLQMHQPPEQAAHALKGLPGAVTARLAALIANSARITDEIQSSLLIALEQEAHRQNSCVRKCANPSAGAGDDSLAPGCGGRLAGVCVAIPDLAQFLLAGHPASHAADGADGLFCACQLVF